MKSFPKIVFSDFDGTLTEQGRSSPVFFDVLDTIKKNSSELVIVTGRPLSWAHFLLTHFELNCVITEGGGMMSLRTKGENFVDISLIDDNEINHLQSVTRDLLQTFDGLKLSEDSICRNTDRAIDLGFLNTYGRDKEIEEFLKDKGINFSRSNVHLNYWAGVVSKKLAIDQYIKKKNLDQSECIFFGDSLNDQSAFEYFDQSIGVSNIQSVENDLTHLPKIILKGNDKKEILGVLHYLKSIST